MGQAQQFSPLKKLHGNSGLLLGPSPTFAHSNLQGMPFYSQFLFYY
jgi:hypothetical protein